MKYVMMIAVFGAMTALFTLIGLSDEPHSGSQTTSFQQ